MPLRPSRARARLVLALDVPSLSDAAPLLALGEEVGVFKVGLELFVASGPPAVEAVHRAGAACFLDLKLHDIPATVAHAVRSACGLGARYLTVHASAGPAALDAAAEAAEGSDTTLLAVTALTSLDGAALSAIGMASEPAEVVRRLAQLAREHGIQGFVCSPREVAMVRELAGPDAILVTPGVRPLGSAAGDQRRVASPTEAIASGADLLVVGRPIRDADDPRAAARALVREIAAATGEPA
jgi:orotidine-5'-phosphate decarboxylase